MLIDLLSKRLAELLNNFQFAERARNVFLKALFRKQSSVNTLLLAHKLVRKIWHGMK